MAASHRTPTGEQAQRVAYCKEHNIHHLLELLAARVLVERPANPFAFLRQLLTSVEASERRHNVYDATRIPDTSCASRKAVVDGEHKKEVDDDDGGAAQEPAAAAAATTATAEEASHRRRVDTDAAQPVASSSSSSPIVPHPPPPPPPPPPTTTMVTSGEVGVASRADADATRAPAARYKITLGLFGLDNAGKTSVLAQLEGEVNTHTLPTIGFTPTQFETDDSDVYLFDLGGAANFRGIWQHYFHDCHGVIYVVDAAADEAVVQQSLGLLRDTLTHPSMHGKPLLLLANKKDLPRSRGEAVVPSSLLAEVVPTPALCRVVATCAIAPDAALEEGVEWLLGAVRGHYADLRRRVEEDTTRVRAEKMRAREALLAPSHTDE